MNNSIKADLRMIRMRNFLDPKRFYKAPDRMRVVLHEGTVIEGPGEYRSSRIVSKDRRLSIVDEVLYDKELLRYSKRKYEKIQTERNCKIKMYKHSKRFVRARNGGVKLRGMY